MFLPERLQALGLPYLRKIIITWNLECYQKNKYLHCNTPVRARPQHLMVPLAFINSHYVTKQVTIHRLTKRVL